MKCYNCQKRLTKNTVSYCQCGEEFCKDCLPENCMTDDEGNEIEIITTDGQPSLLQLFANA